MTYEVLCPIHGVDLIRFRGHMVCPWPDCMYSESCSDGGCGIPVEKMTTELGHMTNKRSQDTED